MIVATSRCEQYGHREFLLEDDESAVPDAHVTDLAMAIEQMVAQGSTFVPGETFQIGWMLTRVQSHGTSHLTLEEPDMEALPIRWVPGVTQTLRQKMLQVYMLDSVALRHEMQIPSIRQSILACDRYTNREFFMTRSRSSNESDSGWFIGCMDRKHDHNSPGNLRCVSLFEAYLGQRGIQGFVSFPVGTMIVVDRANGVSILKDGEPLDVVAGSFLDAWLRRLANGEAKEPYPE